MSASCATASKSCTASTSTSSAAATPRHYGDAHARRSSSGRSATPRAELGLEARFFQTNHEGEFVEHLHRLDGLADAIVLNPGAWTHYSYAIRDALELTGLPAVEVHLSDVDAREPWRRQSVIRELCIARVAGKGPDGYRDALERAATPRSRLSTVRAPTV